MRGDAVSLDEQAARLDAGASRVARAAVAPLVVGFEAQQVAVGPQDLDASIGASLRWEFPLVQRAQGDRAVAEAEARVARTGAALLRRQIGRDVVRAAEALARGLAELDAIEREAVPAAERLVAASEAAFSAGALDYFRVLAARRAVLTPLRARSLDVLESAWAARLALGNTPWQRRCALSPCTLSPTTAPARRPAPRSSRVWCASSRAAPSGSPSARSSAHRRGPARGARGGGGRGGRDGAARPHVAAPAGAGGRRDGPAVRRALAPSLEAVGSVEFDRDRVAEVGSRVEGRVARILVGLGAAVRAGDPLVELESAAVSGALGDYVSAQAAVVAARAESARLARLAADQQLGDRARGGAAAGRLVGGRRRRSAAPCSG